RSSTVAFATSSTATGTRNSTCCCSAGGWHAPSTTPAASTAASRASPTIALREPKPHASARFENKTVMSPPLVSVVVVVVVAAAGRRGRARARRRPGDRIRNDEPARRVVAKLHADL